MPKIHVPFSPYLISKVRRIVRHCDRHRNETVTLRKHITKYKNIRKWIVEILRKFKNRGIKIARVNSILITKSINLQLFTLILYGVGVRCDVDIFKLTASAQSFIQKSTLDEYIPVDLLEVGNASAIPRNRYRIRQQRVAGRQ